MRKVLDLSRSRKLLPAQSRRDDFSGLLLDSPPKSPRNFNDLPLGRTNEIVRRAQCGFHVWRERQDFRLMSFLVLSPMICPSAPEGCVSKRPRSRLVAGRRPRSTASCCSRPRKRSHSPKLHPRSTGVHPHTMSCVAAALVLLWTVFR